MKSISDYTLVTWTSIIFLIFSSLFLSILLNETYLNNSNYSVHLKKNIVINNFFSVFKKTAILLTVLITYW